MNPITRARLFARDYFEEFGVAWSVARMRDCERNGGHRWGGWKRDLIGTHRVCSRCGTSEYPGTTERTGCSHSNMPMWLRVSSAAAASTIEKRGGSYGE